jgi:hypothetical protein
MAAAIKIKKMAPPPLAGAVGGAMSRGDGPGKGPGMTGDDPDMTGVGPRVGSNVGGIPCGTSCGMPACTTDAGGMPSFMSAGGGIARFGATISAGALIKERITVAGMIDLYFARK